VNQLARAPDVLPAEHPQNGGDLAHLIQTIQVLEVREPEQQAIRAALLAKLTRMACPRLAGTSDP
jgi:hypothetical protein